MLNFDYLEKLNEKQKEAVTCLDGPLLIVAGAGSGKTKVLTSSICHIILSGKASPMKFWQLRLPIKRQMKC